jgi:signal transduction histidine kinase
MAPHLADADPQAVILIEDDPGDALLVSRALRKQGQFPYVLEHYVSLEDFLARPTPWSDAVILLDLYLPGYEGLDALRSVLSSAPDVAVVVLTGLDDIDVAVSALAAGAQDYLVKLNVNPHEICRAIRYAAGRRAGYDALARLSNQFVTHVSHELRTPITAARAATEILQEGDLGPLLPDQERCLGILSKSIFQLNDMISDLICSAEISSGAMHLRPRRVPLLHVVENALADLAFAMRSRQNLVQVDVPVDLMVTADPERLAMAVSRIVKNSVEHTPPGGRIDITASPSTNDVRQLSVHIRDTGPGIPAPAIQRLFDRLYQVPNGEHPASRKGLGFGLHLSREIVRAHGGDIRITSRHGEGTTVAVTLPLDLADDGAEVGAEVGAEAGAEVGSVSS